MIAERRLKKRLYKQNLWRTNPAADAKEKASKHRYRQGGRTKDADDLLLELLGKIDAESESTEDEASEPHQE